MTLERALEVALMVMDRQPYSAERQIDAAATLRAALPFVKAAEAFTQNEIHYQETNDLAARDAAHLYARDLFAAYRAMEGT